MRTAPSITKFSVVAFALFVLTLGNFSGTLLRAQETTDVVEGSACAACESSLWEVCTRQSDYSRCVPCLSVSLPVQRFADCRWQASSEELLQNDIVANPAWTIIYVHGNRTSLSEARTRARILLSVLSARTEQPVRVILFSWPSEKPPILLPKRLVEDKKATIVTTSYYLAQFIDRLPAGELRGMVAYSFGCAITSGSIHLLAGGSLAGQHLASSQTHDGASIRVGFLAPAFDRRALTECGDYSLAPLMMDHIVNLYNSNDPILRRFRVFERDNGEAAGLLGLAGGKFSPLSQGLNMTQFDCNSIGSSHSEKDYYECCRLPILLDNVLGK